MPWTTNGSVRIYWEEEGKGEPLLLIMGLSFSLAMWGELRPFLAQHFRLILFDNRCVGRSDTPRHPFSIAAMAQDALCVLDAAGVEAAHVLGFSMGGMMAQELACRSPGRVLSLILGCTHVGGLHCVRASPVVLGTLSSPLMRPDAKLRAMIPYMYHPNTPRERIEADMEVIRAHAPTLRGYLHQIAAIVTWTSWKRLPAFGRPALIVHGDSDLLIPTENARILARRLPNSRLVILPQAGHVFPTDQPQLTRNALFDFLQPYASAA
jgi:3-oxoadipate enol-lactonase